MTANKVIIEHGELIGSGVVLHEQLDVLAGLQLIALTGSFDNVRTLVPGPGISIIDDPVAKEVTISFATDLSYFYEDPAPIYNDTNRIVGVLMSHAPVMNISLYVNGMRLFVGAQNDYVVSGSTVTFNGNSFRSGSHVYASYSY